jgi:outer membrane protein assembly factor BamB
MSRVTPPAQAAQWNSIHGDMRNSDLVSARLGTQYEVAWRVLEGAAVLFGPAVDASGNLYICSGRGPGHSHLHSFDAAGALRWESPIADGSNDALGARVCPFAPLLTDDGGVVVADERGFFCYESNGTLRWRRSLAPLGIRAGFPSAVLSPQGFVGGVSLEGVVLLLDPATGEQAYRPLKLPVGEAPAAISVPPGIWSGMMDASVAQTMFPAFFGTGFPVTNSPAVSAVTGLIYITGAGKEPGKTQLFGIREDDGALRLELSITFDGFCSVTPSVSADGLTVYTGNHTGRLFAFDAQTGILRWQYAPAATAASPTIGPDGTVYSGNTVSAAGNSQLSAIDPESGQARWCRNYDELAAKLLPERPALDGLFPDPHPHASVNSVQTVGESLLLVVLTLGYTFAPPGRGPMTQPHRSVLASIDTKSGELIGYTKLPDSSEAAVVVTANGTVHTPHAALTSSVFLAINGHLPAAYRTPLVPVGGVTALVPTVFP